MEKYCTFSSQLASSQALSNPHHSVYGAIFLPIILASKIVDFNSRHTHTLSCTLQSNVESSTLPAVTIYSLPFWCTRMSDEARVRGSHSCVDCLYIYIYLANAKKLAQSCAVCHHFTLISVRYSYYSSTSQWRKSSASCKIDEGYLFIILRSSTTQRSQTEKKLSISRMITLINLLICETKPWLHDCGNAGNNFQWNSRTTQMSY